MQTRVFGSVTVLRSEKLQIIQGGRPLVTSETFTSNCVEGHTRSGSESEVDQGLQPGLESPRSLNGSRGAVSTPDVSHRLGWHLFGEDNNIQSIYYLSYTMSSIQSENTRHIKNQNQEEKKKQKSTRRMVQILKFKNL